VRKLLSLVLLVSVCFSCDYFSLKKNQKPVLDSIVDFTSVDMPPSFQPCDTLIDAAMKKDCFVGYLQNHVASDFKSVDFKVDTVVNEKVILKLLIDNKGKISLKSIGSSYLIKRKLPLLDSVLGASVQSLPNVYAATKKGIPVTTEYTLPIKIVIED